MTPHPPIHHHLTASDLAHARPFPGPDHDPPPPPLASAPRPGAGLYVRTLCLLLDHLSDLQARDCRLLLRLLDTRSRLVWSGELRIVEGRMRRRNRLAVWLEERLEERMERVRDEDRLRLDD